MSRAADAADATAILVVGGHVEVVWGLELKLKEITVSNEKEGEVKKNLPYYSRGL